MKLYMMVTKDKYELPLAVAKTIRELAKLTGARENTISTSIYHARKRGGKSQYIEVIVEDGDDTDD